MAKPNYQFEKRQKELEKKRKKADKALKKSADNSDTRAAPDQDMLSPATEVQPSPE